MKIVNTFFLTLLYLSFIAMLLYIAVSSFSIAWSRTLGFIAIMLIVAMTWIYVLLLTTIWDRSVN
jgi:hypothetical protein